MIRKSLDAAAHRVALSEDVEGTWTLTENHYREVGKRFLRRRLSTAGYVTLRILSALGIAACPTLIVTLVLDHKTVGTTGYAIYMLFILVAIITAFLSELKISKRFAKIE